MSPLDKLIIIVLTEIMPGYGNKLSNYMREFDKFLSNLDISRKAKKGHLKLFHTFLDYIRLSSSTNQIHFDFTISSQRLNNFETIYKKQRGSLKGWTEFKSILKQFSARLKRLKFIYQTDNNYSNGYQILILNYLDKLIIEDASNSTFRNYKADLKQFAGYLESTGRDLDEYDINKLISDYAIYLENNLRLQRRSVKRKLSAVNSFMKYLKLKPQGLIQSEKAVSDIEKNPKLYENEINSLEFSEKSHSPAHRQNLSYYFSLTTNISIIAVLIIAFAIGLYQQFFEKTTKPLAFPIEPVQPGRIINFQGRLTDKDNNPIVDDSSVAFKIWDQSEEGNLLYDSGKCTIKPDQNGIFYTLIGSTCGEEISSNVFTENVSAYLGLTVGQDEEMKPRQQIASVGYALNTETLQGLSPQSPAGPVSIPFIDKNGFLLLGTASQSAVIKSGSDKLTLEGKILELNTEEGSSGAINLSPDNNGSVNFNLGGFFPANSSGLLNIKADNIISGSLIYGSGSPLTAGYNLLKLDSGNPLNTKFLVDSAGNTYLAGQLKIGNHFQSSSSETLVSGSFRVAGQLYDSGLGFFGTKGNKIPYSFNFTSDLTLEFDFKTGSNKIQIQTNINDDNSKYYLMTWNTDNVMTVEKCLPACTSLSTSAKSWTDSSWHHGLITFSGSDIKWDIDNNSARINTKTSTDVPKISAGYVKFASGINAISNLRISPNIDVILTGGNAKIGGRLEAGDNIVALGQLKTGGYTTAPTAAGEGALYFNSSDDKLYFWNGSSWTQAGFDGTGISSLDVEGDVEIDASDASFTQSLCHSGIDGATNDLQLGDCNGGGADLAEYYGADPTISAGDIVAVKDGAFQYQDQRIGQTSKAYVIKSSKPYQNDLIGIVSTNPYAEILAEGVFSAEEYPLPVALAGRVPLKVTTENGQIKAGDALTSGNLAGFGMKATESGPVVAKALESFIGPDDPAKIIPCPPNTDPAITCGQIVVFLNIGYFEKKWTEEELADLKLVPDKDKYLLGLISKIGIYSRLAAAQIRAGVVDAKSIITERIYARFIQSDEIISGYIEAENIQTQNLSAQNLTANQASFNSITPLEDELAVKGDLKVEGQVEIAGDATVSGTLFADDIRSGQLEQLKSSFGQLMDKLATIEAEILSPTPLPTDTPTSTPVPTATLEPTPNITLIPSPLPTESPTPTMAEPTPTLSVQIDNTASPPATFTDQAIDQTISESNEHSQNLLALNEKIEEYLNQADQEFDPVTLNEDEEITVPAYSYTGMAVTGPTSLADTTIAGQLLISGSLILENNSISSLNETLYLTGQKAIDLMGGKLLVDNNGNLTVSGELLALGGIATDQLKPLNENLTVNLASNLASSGDQANNQSTSLTAETSARIGGSEGLRKLIITGDESRQAAVIDSQGNASFSGALYAQKISLEAENSVGKAILPAGQREIIIYNPNISEKTLIYITPTSTTQNNTLYIADKTVCSQTEPAPIPSEPKLDCRPSFSVGLDGNLTYDVSFNWWLVN